MLSEVLTEEQTSSTPVGSARAIGRLGDIQLRVSSQVLMAHIIASMF